MAFKDGVEAKKIFASYTVWESKNKYFSSEVSDEYEKVWVTSGHCSCDLYSEPFNSIMEAEKLRKRFYRKKYRDKGWSHERIEREVENILKKTSRRNGGLSEPLFHCIKTYTKEVGCCYFHIGWYSGDQNKQGVKIEERLKYSISSGAIKASEVNENILYTFI